MLLVLKPNSEELGSEAARVVANAVRRNPALRLGLATGSTMLAMYQELVRLPPARELGLLESRHLQS